MKVFLIKIFGTLAAITAAMYGIHLIVMIAFASRGQGTTTIFLYYLCVVLLGVLVGLCTLAVPYLWFFWKEHL